MLPNCPKATQPASYRARMEARQAGWRPCSGRHAEAAGQTMKMASSKMETTKIKQLSVCGLQRSGEEGSCCLDFRLGRSGWCHYRKKRKISLWTGSGGRKREGRAARVHWTGLSSGLQAELPGQELGIWVWGSENVALGQTSSFPFPQESFRRGFRLPVRLARPPPLLALFPSPHCR